jgi:hypothetical protein
MTNKGKLWIATLDTRHFTFTACGVTEAKAREAMEAGWKLHAAEYGDSVAPFSDFEDGVNCLQVQVGKCYRDFDQLGEKT